MMFIRPGSEANETKFSKLLRGLGGGGGKEITRLERKEDSKPCVTKSSLSLNQIFDKCIHFLESQNSSYTCKLRLPKLLN